MVDQYLECNVQLKNGTYSYHVLYISSLIGTRGAKANCLTCWLSLVRYSSIFSSSSNWPDVITLTNTKSKEEQELESSMTTSIDQQSGWSELSLPDVKKIDLSPNRLRGQYRDITVLILRQLPRRKTSEQRRMKLNTMKNSNNAQNSNSYLPQDSFVGITLHPKCQKKRFISEVAINETGQWWINTYIMYYPLDTTPIRTSDLSIKLYIGMWRTYRDISIYWASWPLWASNAI